jgi:hypothetical protein
MTGRRPARNQKHDFKTNTILQHQKESKIQQRFRLVSASRVLKLNRHNGKTPQQYLASRLAAQA